MTPRGNATREENKSQYRSMRYPCFVGYCLNVQLPESDEGIKAKLLMPPLHLEEALCLTITLSADYATDNLPNYDFTNLTFQANSSMSLNVDLYTWMKKAISSMWIRFPIEPGSYRPSLTLWSSVEVSVFLDDVKMEYCEQGMCHLIHLYLLFLILSDVTDASGEVVRHLTNQLT